MKVLYKIFGILLVVLIFNSLGFAKAETLEELASEINDIKQEINSLESSDVKESIAIDKAIKELDKAMDFVNKSVDMGDVNGAIATLDFVEKTMSDISASVPKEFKSEIIEKGKEFSTEDMKEISKMTTEMSVNKKKKTKKLAKSMQETSAKGFDVFEVSMKINIIGIKTVDAKEVAESLADTSKIQSQKLVETPKSNNLSKELEDQQRYSLIIGKSPQEVDLALKQVDVIQSADPKKQRAFEIEKYGTLAGVDKNTISKGIDAIYSGDIQAEKQITLDIMSKLSQNPDYEVDIPTSEELDSLMAQNIAVEKAAHAVLNSGINFARGTSGTDVKNLSRQVEDILSASTDQATIDKVVYRINRTEWEVWSSPEAVAANILAEISGKDQVHALTMLRRDQSFGVTGSLAEQAARVQAHLEGDTDLFIDAKYDRLETVELTTTEKDELSKVYGEALSKQITSVAATAAETAKSVNKEAAALLSASQKNLDTFKSVVATPQQYEEAYKSVVVGASTEQMAKQIKSYTESYNTTLSEKIAAVANEAATSSISTEARSSVEDAVSAKDAAWEAYSKDGWNMEKKAAFHDAEKALADAVKEATDSQTASSVADAAKSVASSVDTVSETAKSAATDVSSSVADTAKSAASSVSSSVAQEVKTQTQEVAKEVSKEVTQEVQEVAKEVSQEVKEVTKEVAQEVAQEAKKTAFDYTIDFMKANKITDPVKRQAEMERVVSERCADIGGHGC